MTLPASGQISFSQVNTELGRSSTAQLSFDDAALRALAGAGGSGTQISMSQLHGKSSMSVSGVNDDRSYSSGGGGGNAASFPSVNVSGGTAPYTYSWSFTNNPGGAGLSNSTSQTCTVGKTFTSNSSGGYSATLQCVVTDNVGTQRTASGVIASADWEP